MVQREKINLNPKHITETNEKMKLNLWLFMLHERNGWHVTTMNCCQWLPKWHWGLGGETSKPQTSQRGAWLYKQSCPFRAGQFNRKRKTCPIQVMLASISKKPNICINLKTFQPEKLLLCASPANVKAHCCQFQVARECEDGKITTTERHGPIVRWNWNIHEMRQMEMKHQESQKWLEPRSLVWKGRLE